MPQSQTPIIDIWYGPRQRFGYCGRPQRFVNILGRVRGNAPIDSLVYRLNSGEPQPLSVGPDLRRLAGKGDFNIDLPIDSLQPGENYIQIRAVDVEGGTSDAEVILDFAAQPCPLPYTIDWGKLDRIDDAAQVVDGLWQINAQGISPAEIGYDRLLAIGDMDWQDYQVTVPITVHGMNASAYNSPSRHSGVGIVMRWQGHTDRGEDKWGSGQPFHGPEGYGAIGWYCVFHNLGPVLNFFDPEFKRAAWTPRPLELHRPYNFQVRVETLADGNSHYSLKVWPQDGSEPAEWDLTVAGHPRSLDRGCLLLGAHHIACTFGNLLVEPL